MSKACQRTKMSTIATLNSVVKKQLLDSNKHKFEIGFSGGRISQLLNDYRISMNTKTIIDEIVTKNLPTIEKMFNARVHFGHRSGLRHCEAREFLFGVRPLESSTGSNVNQANPQKDFFGKFNFPRN